MVLRNIIQNSWRSIVVVVTPILLLPLVFSINTQESKAAYGVLVMAMFWMTEAIPIPATALMPIFIFPILGVDGVKNISKNYLKDTNMLMVGGLMVAVAIESSNLHRRVALGILKIVGVQKRWLLLGFMLPTWFLSMWISNTATTAMMFPVANAVLDQFQKGRKNINSKGITNKAYDDISEGVVEDNDGKNQQDIQLEEITVEGQDNKDTDVSAVQVIPGETSHAPKPNGHHQDKEHLEFCKCLALSIAYAANIGGTGTLTGTPPNLVFKNVADEFYTSQGKESPITYTSWMVFAIPLSVICLAIAWGWLQVLYLGLGCNKKKSTNQEEEDRITKSVEKVVSDEYEACGKFRFAEGANIFFFVCLVLLWLLRNPRFMPGWGEIFEKGYVGDASSAILIVTILFAFPKHFPRFDGSKPTGPLLDWKKVNEKFPWGVVLLIGGGFALADVCKVSGLSKYIGSRLESMSSLPDWLIVVIVALLVAGLTEFTSNTATSSLLLPILYSLALQIDLHPLYLMLPGVIAASFAFMLPVATPPNAIVFANGYLSVFDMAKAGIVMNILCIIALTLAVHTWGWMYFDLGDWQNAVNNATTAVM